MSKSKIELGTFNIAVRSAGYYATGLINHVKSTLFIKEINKHIKKLFIKITITNICYLKMYYGSVLKNRGSGSIQFYSMERET